MTAAMCWNIPVTAFAESPEFARTEEEWEALRDNVLEYDEIAGRIEEYNTTVQNNQYEYSKFVREYGRKREDIAQAYRDTADDLEDSMSGEDSGSAMVSDLQLQIQADALRKQADDTVEDSQVYQLSYAQIKDNLILSAQSEYLSYFKSKLELEEAQEQKKVLENTLALTETQRNAGTATDTQVLDAKEAVLEQEDTIANLEQEIENTRQSLLVMLGWKAQDEPEIQEPPEADLGKIEAVDLEADKQTALETNYTLQINRRKFDNAQDSENKKSIQNTIDGNEKQILVSVTNAWNSLQTAKRSYEQAVSSKEAEVRNMELAEQKWSAGMITAYEYEQQQATLEIQRLTVKTTALSLLEAWETYQWNVNGLASAE
ncbi:MAG: TolC family protein [bacterium]|nr:TolC family protein [bacterium]